MSETTLRALRLALASYLLVALVSHLAIGLSRSDLTVVEFFSLFTVLSNALAVTMLMLAATRPVMLSSDRFALFRGAVTLYMTVTALAYAVALATSFHVGLAEPWVDWSLHVVGPLLVVLDWLVHRPGGDLSRISALVWLAFPTAYLGYTLVRGEVTGWYPYPFLDPAETGTYAMVAVWSAAVLVITLGLGYGYQWWATRQEMVAATA